MTSGGHLGRLIAGAALVVAGVLGTALPAQAADGWAYVVVNNRVCAGFGGEVRGIVANVPQTGFTTTAWDNGDNIVHPRVWLGATNQVTVQARCEKRVALDFWQSTGHVTVVGYIRPITTGQTFRVG